MTYLDHNATTDVLPEVKEELFAFMNEPYNASSIHSYGRAARSLLDKSRATILDMLGDGVTKNYDLIFTSSGTEANNLVVAGLMNHHLLVSSIEHASVLEPAAHRDNVTFLPVDENGLLMLDVLEQKLATMSGIKTLVSVMLANNETGVIQKMKEIVAIAHSHGALVHTDAVQAFGKVHVDINELGVDLMTISAHKMGGIFGAAALIKRKGIELMPLLRGGKQEQGLRAGTQNLFAIISFAKAASLVPTLLTRYSAVKSLRDYMEEQILNVEPQAKIYSKDCDRLPNTTYIAMPGVSSEVQLINFDLAGFAVSAGSACSSGKVEVSHVLRAMNAEDNLSGNAIRVSLGLTNTKAEVERFVAAWRDLYVKVVHPSTSERYALLRSGRTDYKLAVHPERSAAESKDERICDARCI